MGSGVGGIVGTLFSAPRRECTENIGGPSRSSHGDRPSTPNGWAHARTVRACAHQDPRSIAQAVREREGHSSPDLREAVSPLQCVAPIQSMSTIRVDPQGARCAHRDRTSGTGCSFAHIRRPFHGPAASRTRATKSVSTGERRPEETLSDTCEPFGSGMASGRAYRLIDLVSSSSIARTAAGIDESNVLTWPLFSI